MIHLVLFTCLPLVAWAAYLDPSLQPQKPLLDAEEQKAQVVSASNQHVVVPLTLNDAFEYTFPNPTSKRQSTSDPLHLQTPLSSIATDKAYAASKASISIPLDASEPGSISFFFSDYDYDSPHLSQQHPSIHPPPPPPRKTPLTHLSQTTRKPYIPLSSIGIRKGGTVALRVSAKAPLHLRTPFIQLPGPVWDILVLATRPEARGNGVEAEAWKVACEDRGRFPDLVFVVSGRGGGDGGDWQREHGQVDHVEQEHGQGEQERIELRKRHAWNNDHDGYQNGEESEDQLGRLALEHVGTEVQELVVTPAQYIMQTQRGECLLLVRETQWDGDEEEEEEDGVVLGWAVMRGRSVVFDFERGVVGVDLERERKG